MSSSVSSDLDKTAQSSTNTAQSSTNQVPKKSNQVAQLYEKVRGSLERIPSATNSTRVNTVIFSKSSSPDLVNPSTSRSPSTGTYFAPIMEESEQ